MSLAMPLLNDLRTRLCADALGARDNAVVMVKIWLTGNDLLLSRTAASSLCSLFVQWSHPRDLMVEGLLSGISAIGVMGYA